MSAVVTARITQAEAARADAPQDHRPQNAVTLTSNVTATVTTGANLPRLAENARLLNAIKAERERRIRSGEAAREAAQQHFANADDLSKLGELFTNVADLKRSALAAPAPAVGPTDTVTPSKPSIAFDKQPRTGSSV